MSRLYSAKHSNVSATAEIRLRASRPETAAAADRHLPPLYLLQAVRQYKNELWQRRVAKQLADVQ